MAGTQTVTWPRRQVERGPSGFRTGWGSSEVLLLPSDFRSPSHATVTIMFLNNRVVYSVLSEAGQFPTGYPRSELQGGPPVIKMSTVC